MPITNQELTRLIQSAIQHGIADIIDAEVEKAKREVDQRVRNAVCGICTRVAERMDYETHGNEMLVKLYIPKGGE